MQPVCKLYTRRVWLIHFPWRHGSDWEGNRNISANNVLDQREMFVVLTCTQNFLVNCSLFRWQIGKVCSQDKFIFLPIFTLDLSISDKSTVTIYTRRWTWSSVLLLGTTYTLTMLCWWTKPLTKLLVLNIDFISCRNLHWKTLRKAILEVVFIW